MEINDSLIGGIFRIRDVPENTPCLKCNSCLRLRIMELGMYKGEKIELVTHKYGLWMVNILNESNTVVSTVAMRDDEINRIILEDDLCDFR